MFQYLSLTIVAERDIFKFNLVIQTFQRFRIRNLLNLILCFQDFINTFHRSQTFRNVVSCFSKVFQRIDYTIQDNHIEDECRSIDGCILSQNQCTTKPQYGYNQNGSQKLTHRMCHSLTYSNLVCCIPKFVTTFGEAVNHFIFRNKSLDDAQTSQCFFQLRHRITPLCLCFQ